LLTRRVEETNEWLYWIQKIIYHANNVEQESFRRKKIRLVLEYKLMKLLNDSNDLLTQ